MSRITKEVEVSVSPKELAALFWGMDSGEQAEFFEELQEIAGSHKLVLQGLSLRDDCEARSPKALEGFQNLSSCAFKWLVRNSDNNGFDKG